MKAKVKLDVTSIKNWMLAHGEKLAFGVVALVFLWFAYSAFSRESLDSQYEPSAMQQKASQVTQHVANSQWNPATQDVVVVDYMDRARSKEVSAEAFSLKAFDPPSADPKAKRGEPKVLPPEDLRVAAGIGVFRTRGAKADGEGELLAQPWAVVTAVVPYQKQVDEFAATFEQAVGYSKSDEEPRYYEPLLQRAEVTGSSPEQLGEWKDVPRTEAFEEKWNGTKPPELAASEYLHDQLTGQLGPLLGGEWGEEVIHPKVLRAGQRRQAPPAEIAEEEKPEETAENPRFHRDQPVQPKRDAPGQAKAKAAEEEGVPYRLLRAFDYTVEAGKRYRYRIILAVVNPNQGKMPHELVDPATASKSHLVSEPTPPTDVVVVPDGHGVLAGDVKAGSRFSEPTATIVVTAIDDKTGLTAGTKLEGVHRGAVGNTEVRTVPVRNPLSRATTEVTLDFASNFTLLDIYGGESLSGKARATTPGEVLLMDADGKMSVRSELADQSQRNDVLVEEEKEPEKDKKEEPKKILARPRR